MAPYGAEREYEPEFPGLWGYGPTSPASLFLWNRHLLRTAMQIKLQKVANFRLQKTALQRTTIHHKSITISPSKHHEKHAIFPQPPFKKSAHKPRKNRSMGAQDSLGYFRKKITADSNKPAHSTDRDTAGEEVDSAAASAVAAYRRPTGSVRPGTAS